MSLLPNQEAQNILWKRLVSGRISTYLDALRYRYDGSDDFKRLDAKESSSAYLTDLLNGFEEPLDGFFPAFRLPIVEWLTEERGKPLSIIGKADANGLQYKIHSGQTNEPRVVVGVPDFPGIIRGVDFNLVQYRTDSARLLGMTLLKKGLEEVIKVCDVNGGLMWSAERLIARVRLLAGRYGFDLSIDDDLDRIEKLIRPHASKRIDDGFFIGQERFSFQSILDDIAILRSAEMATLDPWWLRLGWKDDLSLVSNENLARILDEEYRRVQIVYTEIVRTSLPRFANDMKFFPILPIRWNLTVVRRSQRYRTFVIYPIWAPVRDWKDAGADVTFAEKGPDLYPPWEEVRDALIALGRPPNVPHYGGFTTHFGFGGTMATGSFTGTSPVINEVISWLCDELRHIFRNLPPSDGAFAV